MKSQNDPELRVSLSRVLLASGRRHDAILMLQSVKKSQANEQVLLSLGRAFMAADMYHEALDSLLSCCSIAPESWQARELCAIVAAALGHFDIAVEQRRCLLAAQPESLAAQCALATALWCAGEMQECLELSERICHSFPHEELAHAAWLRALDHTTFSAKETRCAWERWAACSLHRTPRLAARNVMWDPDRPLSVGYLLDEIDKRPDSYFILPLLENRSDPSLNMFCYLVSPQEGGAVPDLKRFTENVRDVRGWTTHQIAGQIQADGMDILVNVSYEFRQRHTAIFGHRAAPIQIELPNYPATTGHPETDFIFSDGWICPDGYEHMYSEKVRRLDHSYMAWTPPPSTPAVTSLPVATNGFFTFGLFQKPSKLNASVWDSVCDILHRIPTARLLIHFNSRDLDLPGSRMRVRLSGEIQSRGIDVNRIAFVGTREHIQHLETVAQADIALDTFPYNGATTTGDCLWMGVPVVTLACETHAGRVGLSMLSRVEMPHLVASTAAEYVNIALQLAADEPSLSRLRAALRQKMSVSSLTDARAAMSGIEREYRLIWRSLCSTSPASALNRSSSSNS